MFSINVFCGYFKYFHLTTSVALFLFSVNELLEFTEHIEATVIKDGYGSMFKRDDPCFSDLGFYCWTWMVA